MVFVVQTDTYNYDLKARRFKNGRFEESTIHIDSLSISTVFNNLEFPAVFSLLWHDGMQLVLDEDGNGMLMILVDDRNLDKSILLAYRYENGSFIPFNDPIATNIITFDMDMSHGKTILVYEEIGSEGNYYYARLHEIGQTESDPEVKYVGYGHSSPLYSLMFPPKIVLSKGGDVVRGAILIFGWVIQRIDGFLNIDHLDFVEPPASLGDNYYPYLADIDVDSRGRIALSVSWSEGSSSQNINMLHFHDGFGWKNDLRVPLPPVEDLELAYASGINFVADDVIAGNGFSILPGVSTGRLVAEIDKLEQLRPFYSTIDGNYTWGPSVVKKPENYNIVPYLFQVTNQKGMSAGIEIKSDMSGETKMIELSIGKYANTKQQFNFFHGPVNYPTFIGARGHLKYGIGDKMEDDDPDDWHDHFWRQSIALSKNGTTIMAYGYKTTNEEWKLFARSLNNYSSYISLPAYSAYGNKILDVPFQTYVNEVNFSFGGRTGNVEIKYDVYDVDNATEIEILINGHSVGYVPQTNNDSWRANQTITLPSAHLNNPGINVITFNNTHNPTSSYRWGVRNVSITE